MEGITCWRRHGEKNIEESIRRPRFICPLCDSGQVSWALRVSILAAKNEGGEGPQPDPMGTSRRGLREVEILMIFLPLGVRLRGCRGRWQGEAQPAPPQK